MDIYFGRERHNSISIGINIRPDGSPGFESFIGGADGFMANPAGFSGSLRRKRWVSCVAPGGRTARTSRVTTPQTGATTTRRMTLSRGSKPGQPCDRVFAIGTAIVPTDGPHALEPPTPVLDLNDR